MSDPGIEEPPQHAGPTPGRTAIELCGSLTAEIAGRSVTSSLPGRQGRALFAFLVVNRHRPVTRHELIDVLWPEYPPEAPEAGLSTVLARARRALGEGVIDGRAELWLRLEPDADIDVERAFSSRYPANDDPTIDPSWTTVSFAAGRQHMDGATAIRYARARYANIPEEASDFARAQRQQRLMAAISAKLRQPIHWWRAFGVMNAIWAGAFFTLGPVIAKRTIGIDGWGYLLSSEAVGLVLMTVVLLRLRLRYPLRSGMIGVVLLAGPMFMLGAHPTLWPLVALAFLSGCGVEVFSIGWQTALHEHIPNDVLSRVSSYDALGSFVAMPLGQLAFGPLSQVVDIRVLMMGSAVVFVLIALATLASSSVRNLERAQDYAADTSSPESLAHG